MENYECTNTNPYVYMGSNEREGCTQNCGECSYYGLIEKPEPVNKKLFAPLEIKPPTYDELQRQLFSAKESIELLKNAISNSVNKRDELKKYVGQAKVSLRLAEKERDELRDQVARMVSVDAYQSMKDSAEKSKAQADQVWDQMKELSSCKNREINLLKNRSIWSIIKERIKNKLKRIW